MKQPSIPLAKPDADIVEFFHTYPSRVLRHSDIQSILSENRKTWRLARSTSVQRFINYMLGRTQLKKVKLQFPQRIVIRYTWGNVSTYELVSTLEPQSYFTHYTAMHLHDLTDQVPKTIYLNKEQPPKRRLDADLDQARIDAAFKRPARVSSNMAEYNGQRVCLLNGMYTGQLGVIGTKGLAGEFLRVTSVERTLIDVAVRPAYSGGVFEVLRAYKQASGKVSINKLSAMLEKLSYVYPYHQAIGFYLERARAYKRSQIELLSRFPMKYDFYLCHKMRETEYQQKWRLFVPKGF